MIRTIAIAGGAQGIGRATAEACAAAGMTVVIGDVDGAACAAVAAKLRDRAVGLPLDPCNAQDFEGFLDYAEGRVGPLDAIVNSAEVAPAGTLTGTRLALLRFLPRDHGHIVNVVPSSGRDLVEFTRAVRAQTRGTGMRTTLVVARRSRNVRPAKVADRVLDALQTGRGEVSVRGCVLGRNALPAMAFGP